MSAANPVPRIADSPTGPPLLEGRGLVRDFALRRLLPGSRRGPVRAVAGVDLRFREGEALGLVGESGSGKTTLARLMMGLLPPTAGEVHFDGEPLAGGRRGTVRRLRREVQMVFQQAGGALDPRQTVGRIVAEPLEVHRVGTPSERSDRVHEVLDEVGLEPGLVRVHPHALSGGQRQRVGIARALALRPRALVLDEPVSALDLPEQARIVNLLMELRDRRGVAVLVVAHDLRVVGHLCERVAVMHAGCIVERGPVDAVFGAPRHPHTRALLEATPELP